MQSRQRRDVDDERAPRAKPEFAGPAVRHFSGEALFDGAREVTIEHNQRVYTLRITAQGKLILTA
jgi:hemin uptake protein HemP